MNDTTAALRWAAATLDTAASGNPEGELYVRVTRQDRTIPELLLETLGVGIISQSDPTAKTARHYWTLRGDEVRHIAALLAEHDLGAAFRQKVARAALSGPGIKPDDIDQMLGAFALAEAEGEPQ